MALTFFQKENNCFSLRKGENSKSKEEKASCDSKGTFISAMIEHLL